MKILAIDTSSAVLSVAACRGTQLATRLATEPRQHAERILSFIDAVLDELDLQLSQLDAIAYGYGPGSFTSLRIGLGVIQGLALGADLRVIPISSLLAVAQSACPEKYQQALVCMDARMGEVYSARCLRNEQDLMQLQAEEQVLPPAALTLPTNQEWIALGNGYSQYADQFPPLAATITDCWPLASAIIELAKPALKAGNTLDPAEILPKYVRNKVAKKSAEQA